LNEYDAWKEEHNDGKGWKIKYYKGLGTSTSIEAKEYFSDLSQHKLDFEYTGDENVQDIEMAFSKKKADARKDWLNTYDAKAFVDHTAESLNYSDFIHKELVHFSNADNARSIPSMVDGLKPGQRKVLFACFKRKLKSEIKVAQLAGYVSEHSAYHHGEASLCGTIVNMAQNFTGSNNMNMLDPRGQFGTRLQGGKDAASPRYIFTQLTTMARSMFPQEDDAILNYLTDDGLSVEPSWYMPLLPMVLVNGADGIGTGWSTSVPNYNPQDIIANVRRSIAGEELVSMVPWYRGFVGGMERKPKDPKSFESTGIITVTGDTTVEITELPVHDFREHNAMEC
jgi:DNA topoisomerase-2